MDQSTGRKREEDQKKEGEKEATGGKESAAVPAQIQKSGKLSHSMAGARERLKQPEPTAKGSQPA